MKTRQAVTCVLMIAVWQFFAALVHNDILIPYPGQVMADFIRLFGQSVLYESTWLTTLRVLKGFLISLLCALAMSILADAYPSFRQYFNPIQVLAKTIPNVCYIILALIWLGTEGAVSAVSFMILFPVFFNSFLNALDQEDQNVKDAEALYREKFWPKTLHKTLPQLRMEILKTGKTAASLGFKVGVMAEILGQVRSGIGKQLYLAKINLDTASLLAWTMIIICVSILFDQLFDRLITYTIKEEKGWKN